MTEDEIRKEKGELLLEWEENQQELQRKRSLALKMSQALLEAAQALKLPEYIQLPNEETPSRYSPPGHSIKNLNGLDVEAIRGLRDAIRALLDQQEILKKRKVGFSLE